MRKFGLIGFPLGHSFSKQYFSEKFKRESINDCSYDNYELKDLSQLRDLLLREKELCGLNVTIPYKTDIFSYLDYTDAEAVEVGAVNVLKISSTNGSTFVKGYNTDIIGFKDSLLPYLQGRIIDRAIILGTGGSSKAVAFVLGRLGIDYISISRNSDRNLVTYNQLTDNMIIDSKLIINTTPLGMFPAIDEKPDINYRLLSPEHILYDLVYNPLLTAFLKMGKERGCKILGGEEMLHLQAEKSWAIWNDSSI